MDDSDFSQLGGDFKIKSNDSGEPIVNPRTVADGEPVKRKQGRPRVNRDSDADNNRGSSGSRASDIKTKNSNSLNADASLDGFARILTIIHASAATFTKIPEIELDADDAKTITTEIHKTFAMYGVKIDPKLEQVAALIGVASQIYGMKYLTYKLRLANEKKE